MQQHPIPQNVTSYQFRLVGDMTLKQFGLLASGVVAGFIIYQLPIHALLKWPFILISAFSGFALAFVPIEDRPLDRWLAAFLKSVYSPTQFYWAKSPQLPSYLQSTPIKKAPAKKDAKQPVKDRAQLEQYLQTLPIPQPQNELDQKENKFLDIIHQLFQTIHPTSVSATPITDIPEPPKLPQVRVRKLTGLNQPLKGEIRVEPAPPKKIPPSPQKQPTPKKEPTVEFKPLLFSKKDFANLPSATASLAGPSQQATTNPKLPFPAPPEKPNIIVGMVIDKYDRLIENAIIEIRNANHHPVRAVKTNKLGQFFTVTALPNGKYDIIAEKDGYDFDILNLELTGKIIDPVQIRANNEGPTPFK